MPAFCRANKSKLAPLIAKVDVSHWQIDFSPPLPTRLVLIEMPLHSARQAKLDHRKLPMIADSASKRRLAAVLAGSASALAAQVSFAQQVPDKIRIGYAVSLTGPFAGPASMLPVANYRLWAKQVNAKGGILIKSPTSAFRLRSLNMTTPAIRRMPFASRSD